MLAPEMARLIEEYLARFRVVFPPDARLVPVPLHPRRERRRGFNQSLLLAEELSIRTKIPAASLLARTKNTNPQVSLSFDARKKNVADAFAAAPEVATRCYILVDDVSTTGATIEEASRTLRRAGARTIWAITFAH